MRSRFEHLKQDAIKLRIGGSSLKDIEGRLKIPRSTLSGWMRHVRLTRAQQKSLDRRRRNALRRARAEAIKWHNAQKSLRLDVAKQNALASLLSVDYRASHIELALAFLYLGEGAKRSSNTMLGNSDPEILRFFVTCLRSLYAVPIEKIKCDLHLRADQSPKKAVSFWAKALALPKACFKSVSIDKRTTGRPTYASYKGVCVVRCGRVDIERKLGYIAREFCQRIVDEFRKSA